MTDRKTYFTINLPTRYRPLLEQLAIKTRRSMPNVVACLLEQGARRPELVGMPVDIECPSDELELAESPR